MLPRLADQNLHLTKMKRRLILGLMSICTAFTLTGCLESSFQLAAESRLPNFIKLPANLNRPDVSLTLNYYSNPFGPNAKFILKNRKGDVVEQVSGNDKPLSADVTAYPLFISVEVNGVREIIEHRTKGPIFYVSDVAAKTSH